ncbi:MAG: TetR/AcrR family transcriptional regulator [Crocinitomicaceae bacterium]|nr:TetR/AcrR family transcriptional regulator [Crocinitomicaceae bacterium]
MKKTKESLLKVAQRLFTKQGVAEVSLRSIAAEAGISHSNLIYHYPTKNDLIIALHNELLANAIALNQKVKVAVNPIEGLFLSTEAGFRILYEFRFLMLDLNYILRANKSLLKTFRDLEKVRAGMYQAEIKKAVDLKLMRNELYTGEFDELIVRIKIFSEAWIPSSEIYDSGPVEKIIQKYTQLFMGFFFPYLTEKGRKLFEKQK